MVGIVGYGTYVPRMRVKVDEIARVWGKEGARISKGLGINEKAVASFDEDSCSFAVEASRVALKSCGADPKGIGAVFVGSESKPYAVKPTATMVAEAIGATPEMTAADFEFACKAGTAGVQACMGMVSSGMVKYGLAVGSDTAQGRPNDALEYSAGGGAAALIIGKEGTVADIDATYSFTTDTPDFWRRQHAEFPRHAGRFTAEPAYFKHVLSGAKGLLAKTGTKPEDYDFAVFHQPNGKFPLRAATMLGFEETKAMQGLITPFIGNTYSAAAMIGLCSVLDVAKPGQRILVVSYGSGAGSDAFKITVKEGIEAKRPKVAVLNAIEDKEYVDYAGYVKHRRKIKSL
ncbi:hydroxymethylglutaryl-CoA synthase [Candidatus Micrarchaeota archaeon CG1_02_51_15]|nr:MAG: hydroxymethylglutaryl-CoA synthase [Candidatus Micrarchaeota archaeon CG1_02_51_15]